jgi:hypothetical protein
MPHLELIFQHSESADGCNARRARPSVSSDLKNASKQRPVAQTDPRPRPIRSKIRYRKLSQFWGDVIAALRITLIANAFPEAEIDRLSAAVSSGFARGKVRKAPRRVVNLIGFAGLAMYCRNAAIR